MFPSWSAFAWSCFLFRYRSIKEDHQYQLVRSKLDELWQDGVDVSCLSTSLVDELIVGKFLNQWSCRLSRKTGIAGKIQGALAKISPSIAAMSACDIRTPMGSLLPIGTSSKSLGNLISSCYEEVNGCAKGVAGTVTSKLLHMILPRVFVMWDGPISSHYRIKVSPEGFRLFHEQMNQFVNHIDEGFRGLEFGSDATGSMRFEGYLSSKLGCTNGKSAAKFVDEFNWMVHTRKLPVPPQWHPC